jgi:hypothetical protein
VLLSAANHDYNGHRVKAMNAIEKACNILEPAGLTQPSVHDRIKALQDYNAAAAAKAQGAKGGLEPQALSDIQLYQAACLIQGAAVTLADSKQPTALQHAENALNEVRAALKTR